MVKPQSFTRLLRKAAFLTIALISLPTLARAQDFLSGFAPEQAKKEHSSQAAKQKKANKSTKKVSLPDKPNVTDAKGRKQGEWAKKYPNGRYVYTATFKDGKPIGKVTRFDEEGHKTVVLTYSAKSDTVKAVFYHPNGKPAARGAYVNNKREGLWRTYADDGILIESGNYSKNKLHGKRCFYYENGDLFSVCIWADSLREGPYVKYFPSGAKEIEANFHGDVLDGEYKSWGADGKIASKGIYKSGVTVGKWHIRYTDANIEGDIVYDDHGIIVNTAEADSLLMKRDEYYRKQIGTFKDPEDYIDNPEEFFK